MKKFIYLILLFILFIPFVVNGKEVNDIACNYKIVCKDPINDDNVELGYFQALYYGYNDGNYKDGTFEVIYFEKQGVDGLTVTPGSSFTKYLNYGFGNKRRNMLFFRGSTKGENFAIKYSEQSNCPTLYCEVNSSNILIDVFSGDVSGMQTSTSELVPYNSIVRSNNESWIKWDDFYSKNNNENNGNGKNDSKPKEPKVCSYNIKPQGEYYDSGVGTTAIDEVVDVVLTTNYNPTTGNASNYIVSVNEAARSFTSLDDEVLFTFKGKVNKSDFTIKVEPSQLKKLFSNECVAASNVFMYLHKDAVGGGQFTYYLTTDESEVKAFILDEDDDHNNTGNGKQRKSLDGFDFDVNDTPQTCDKILGPVLTPIVRAGITIMQIVAAIITILKGMLVLIPAVMAKDGDAIKRAGKTLVTLGIILVIIIILRPVVKLIGSLLEYDLNCLFD